MSGLFISFEGIDGSGKSLQAALLRDRLSALGQEPRFYREPGGSEISEQIREIILSKENAKMADISEVLLYAAARAQLVSELIKPSLSEGKVVICDRFVDSSFAYQSFGRGLSLSLIKDINAHAIQGIMPNLTVLIDINPAIAAKRLAEGREKDRLESEKDEFHLRVAEGYRRLAEADRERYFVVNGEQSPESIHEKILERVLPLLDISK